MAEETPSTGEPSDAADEAATTPDDPAADEAVLTDDAPTAEGPESEGPESEGPESEGPESEGTEDAGPPAEHAVILERLERELGDDLVEHVNLFGTLTIRVRPDAWRRVAEVARRPLECDYLSFIAGVDWQPAPREGDEDSSDTSAPVQPEEMTFGAAGSAGRFQVFAHVQSTSRHWGVTLKTDVDEESPVAESWVGVYPGADWHERECWEMYGIRFDGHPNLRHLYLPGEFEGNPLRKDFPLLARVVKPWPGLVDVEPMLEEPIDETSSAEGSSTDAEATSGTGEERGS